MATDLAQQIRDRLDGLGPLPAMKVGFPEPWTPDQREKWAQAFKAEVAKSRTEPAKILPSGPKVYPGFEQMRDVILAVLELHAYPEGSGIPGEIHCGELIDWVDGGCPTVRIIAEKLGIEVADA